MSATVKKGTTCWTFGCVCGVAVINTSRRRTLARERAPRHAEGNFHCPGRVSPGMRMLFDIFGQTLRTLWAHKLRSFLTMFGIAWGVGSLLLLVGLGEGFRSGNRKQFDEIGENVLFIFGGRAPAMNGSFTSLRQYYRSEEHTSELQSHSFI